MPSPENNFGESAADQASAGASKEIRRQFLAAKKAGERDDVVEPLSEDELYERVTKLFDLEELERRKAAEREGFTIDQVMEHLNSLESRK